MLKLFELVVFQIATRRHVHFATASENLRMGMYP